MGRLGHSSESDQVIMDFYDATVMQASWKLICNDENESVYGKRFPNVCNGAKPE